MTDDINEQLSDVPILDNPEGLDQEQDDEGGKLRQADYTRKMQKLAEERRAFEAERETLLTAKNLMDSYNATLQDPESAKEFARNVNEFVAKQYGTSDNSGDVDMDRFTEEERLIYEKNQALERELREMKALLKEVAAPFQESKAMTTALAELKAMGIEATPDEIKEAVQTTGKNDFVAAFALKLARDGRAAQDGQSNPGTVPRKPNTPGGDSKTFDPNDPNLDADKMFDLMNRGYQPR